MKAEPPPGSLSQSSCAAHHVGQLAADGQAQARAAEPAGDGAVGLFEAAEQAVAGGGVEADAGVLDREAQDRRAGRDPCRRRRSG